MKENANRTSPVHQHFPDFVLSDHRINNKRVFAWIDNVFKIILGEVDPYGLFGLTELVEVVDLPSIFFLCSFNVPVKDTTSRDRLDFATVPFSIFGVTVISWVWLVPKIFDEVI